MFRCAVHQNEFTTFGNENRIFFFSIFLKERRQLLYKFRSGGKGRESRGLAQGLPLK